MIKGLSYSFYLFWACRSLSFYLLGFEVFYRSIASFVRVYLGVFYLRVYITPLYYTIYVNLLNKLREGFALPKFMFS